MSGIVLHCAPHPDDEAIGAPATLMALRDAGWRVVNLACGLGDPGRRRLREAELREACRLAGFELRLGGGLDGRAAVHEAIAELRPEVVVSELGTEQHAYGEYFGDGVAREGWEDRIVIYRDTLERDFGHDPRLLAAQVEQTLRHELAHHLGWDEGGVGGLGL